MKIIVLMFVLIATVGCATRNTQETKIQARLPQEAVTDGPALGKSLHHLIEESKTLTKDQKVSLVTLVDDTAAKNKLLLEKSYKMRSLLAKELLSEKIDYKMVNQLKKDIRQAELERLKNSLQTMDEMSSQISHLENKDSFAEEMLHFDRMYR